MRTHSIQCAPEEGIMAKKGPKKAGKGEVLVIASKMKDAIRKHNCNVSSDVVDALSAKVHSMIAEAAGRCKDNGRKTVRGYDF
jgi:hypothetical protein